MLRLFGLPTLDTGERPVVLPFERRSQLLVYLAARGSWVARPELAALLWPELSPALANANLRKALFRLSGAPWAPPVEQQGPLLRVPIPTDVAAFERALRENRLRDAVDACTGDLLTGFDDDGGAAWGAWLRFERDRLRGAWRTAALALATAADAGEAAVELSRRLLDADPDDEDALAIQLRALIAAGRGEAAREAYRIHAARLRAELGLAPSKALRAIVEALDGVTAAVPAPAAARAGAAPATPPRDDDFVGRAAELAQIDAGLAGPARLLTLLGPGGVGKTRLARRALAAHAARQNGAIRTAFVALEDLDAPGELAARIAQALAIPLQGAAPARAQVIAALGDRPTLLVLDNFESVLPAAGEVDALLAACPALSLVVTSRARLGLAAETLLAIEGLPFPDAGDDERLASFDAARLFIDAARKVEPRLAVAAEAAAIADICRQVEGLPLALELAASWTRVLSCAQIAAELREGSELLRTTDASRPARHASMQAVFEHSWRLLGAAERDAMQRLAVFRDGFGADSARAVAAVKWPVLAALVDRSLLRKDGLRLQPHPLVQQWLAERPADAALQREAEAAHAAHFLDLLAQSAAPVANGVRDALDRIEREFGNVRQAWRHAVAGGDAAALRAGATALRYFCDHRGRYEVGVDLLEPAIDVGERSDPVLAARLRGAVAHLVYRQDRYAEATQRAEAALAAARACGDAAAQALALSVLGTCAWRLDRLDEAERHFAEALEQETVAGDLRRMGAMRLNLAAIARADGRPDDARRLYEAAMQAQRDVGDVAGEALAQHNIGRLLHDQGDDGGALASLHAALALCERHALAGFRALVLGSLTNIAVGRGDVAEARRRGAEAEALLETSGDRGVYAHLLVELASLALLEGDLPQARRRLADAIRLGRRIGRPSVLAEAVARFPDLLARQGATRAADAVRGYVATDLPGLSALERAQARARLGGRPAPPWPGLTLDGLCERIVLEADTGHVALAALLGSA